MNLPKHASIPSQRPPAGQQKQPCRADEAEDLLSAVTGLVVESIRDADGDGNSDAGGGRGDGARNTYERPRTTLIEQHAPLDLEQLLDFPLPDEGQGRSGLLDAVRDVLRYSVNTWDQGFLDKLYASTTPVGVAAELVLAALNTNVHVYTVSPALTVVERKTAKALAALVGWRGAWAGGVSQPGGSAANQSSIVIARNNLFPETKTEGNGSRRFVLFTSAHGHYSVEKAAQMFGFGSSAVRSVAVDESGCMRPDELDLAVRKARNDGETPFYVNATAGTTVLGAFDPLDKIASVCEKYGLWMHVDGSWGGPVMFSKHQKHKLRGVEKAHSMAVCPHKMMGVPVTCSFLLSRDLRQFHKGMTLPAGYLFHDAGEDSTNSVNGDAAGIDSTEAHLGEELESKDVWDLADLTPQCGRRGDSLKLALTWRYYGSAGIESYINHGFEVAVYLASVIASNPKFTLVSENPPPCLQVCFYFNKQTQLASNNRTTETMAKALVLKGFMIDYAPGDEGKFLRVVVNGQTRKDTVDGLIKAIESAASNIQM